MTRNALIAVAAAPGPQLTLWPLWSKLANRRPVLALRGQETDLLSPRTFARMRKTAPRAVLVEVPGVGHAPMLDEPVALQAITEFLAGLP